MRRGLIILLIGIGLVLSPITAFSFAGLFESTAGLPAGSAAGVAPGQGSFLVAKRSLQDPGFAESVVYLVGHGEDGSIGLIVNRRSQLDLADTVPDLAGAPASEYRLYYGGPVDLSLVLMLVRGETVSEGLIPVADGVYISSERPVIEAALAGPGDAQELRFYLGYSGWAAGQLEFEITRDSWHVVPGDADAIFSADTGLLWDRLIDRLEPAGIQVDADPAGEDLALGE